MTAEISHLFSLSKEGTDVKFLFLDDFLETCPNESELPLVILVGAVTVNPMSAKESG